MFSADFIQISLKRLTLVILVILLVFIIQVLSQRMCRKSIWEMCVQLVKVKLPQDRQPLEQV